MDIVNVAIVDKAIDGVYKVPIENQMGHSLNYVVDRQDGVIYSYKGTGDIEKKKCKFVKKVSDVNPSLPIGRWINERL